MLLSPTVKVKIQTVREKQHTDKNAKNSDMARIWQGIHDESNVQNCHDRTNLASLNPLVDSLRFPQLFKSAFFGKTLGPRINDLISKNYKKTSAKAVR